MAARHIAGRRRWSVWQPVAALEDEGRATEEFLRQIVMTHMMMFDLYDRSCSVVDSRSPPTLSKYRRVRLLVYRLICLLEGKSTDFLRPMTIISLVLDRWIFKLFWPLRIECCQILRWLCESSMNR